MLLQQTVSRPTEQTWEYPMLGAPFKTELYESLHSRFCDIATLGKTFRFAWDASSELGGWCSDRVWHYVLAEEVLPRIEGSVSRAIEQSLCTRRSAKIEAETQRLREASELVMKYKILSPHSPNQMSPKVSRLCEGLTTYFERPTDTKCIVFTRQRHTARLLGDLFMHLGIRNLRPGVLIGVRSGDDAGMNTSFRQQFVTLANFRTGEINCLVWSTC
jgi:endoribonuclease Dicer